VDDIEVGDMVLVNPHTLKLVDIKGTGRKLIQCTIGPFEVLEKINDQVYRLRLPSNYTMHPVFNLAHLKKYKPSPAKFGDRTELPRAISEAQEEYEVESILGMRIETKRKKDSRVFLIRWKGYRPEDDSWIPEANIRNAPQLKKEFLAKLRGK
jgi:hypothetical protein